MFNFIEKYKKIFVMGIIFFFSAVSGFAYVKTCCQMEKSCQMEKAGDDHSCCVKKTSFNYKQASKCECKISMPRDLVFENKDTKDNLKTQDNIASLYLNDSNKYLLPKKEKIAAMISSKKHFQKIFLEKCSLLL